MIPRRTTFASRTRVDAHTGCIVWTGLTTSTGYGRIKHRGRRTAAHRVAWELANGPVQNGLFVLHHCDNPLCVNVAHLFLGTAADNSADMVAKGRSNHGERNPLAKINADIARSIVTRVANGEMKVAVARSYGISESLVRAVVLGKRWGKVVGRGMGTSPPSTFGLRSVGL